MRTTRILLAALSLTLVAACTAEPVAVVRPVDTPAFDGVGVSGSGNSTSTDTTTVTNRGVGFVGTGN
jgi:hypothetical protein